MLIVFVSSEGKGPKTLLTHSTSSSMITYRIEELDPEEADSYLQKVMNIKTRTLIKRFLILLDIISII
jgi:hypothetical protein